VLLVLLMMLVGVVIAVVACELDDVTFRAPTVLAQGPVLPSRSLPAQVCGTWSAGTGLQAPGALLS
jgi:hypothetical protein